MRIKRGKGVKKTLLFYSLNYNLHPPYHILFDGTFINHALSVSQPIKEMLPRVFDKSETKLYTTSQVVSELTALGLHAAVDITSEMRVLTPNDAETPRESILKLVQNSGLGKGQFFFVASTDPKLLAEVRILPRTAVLYMHNVVLLLEGPTPGAVAFAEEKQRRLIGSSRPPVNAAKPPRHERKAKGPNPLSCRKKGQQLHSSSKCDNDMDSARKKSARRGKRAVHKHEAEATIIKSD